MVERENLEAEKQSLKDQVKGLAEISMRVPGLAKEGENEMLELIRRAENGDFEIAEGIISNNRAMLEKELEETKAGKPWRPLPGYSEEKDKHNLIKIDEGLKQLEGKISEQLKANEQMRQALSRLELLSKKK